MGGLRAFIHRRMPIAFEAIGIRRENRRDLLNYHDRYDRFTITKEACKLQVRALFQAKGASDRLTFLAVARFMHGGH